MTFAELDMAAETYISVVALRRSRLFIRAADELARVTGMDRSDCLITILMLP